MLMAKTVKKSKGRSQNSAYVYPEGKRGDTMGRSIGESLEYGNALFLGLRTGIWMFSLLCSLNCRHILTKIILYICSISQC